MLRSKNRKILFLVPRLNDGGGEKVVLSTINELIKDYEVTVVIVIGGGRLESNLPKEVAKYVISNSEYIDQPQNIFKMILNILFFLPYLVKLAFKHNVILAAGEFGGSLYIGAILNMISKRPLIGWAHGEVFKMIKLSKVTLLRKRIHMFLLKWAYKKAHIILAVSEKTKLDLENNIPNIGDRIRVIYNPVSLDKINEKAKDPLLEKEYSYFSYPVITAAGRHEYRKGFDIIIKAHALLIKEGFFHYLIIVGGEGEETSTLNKIIKDLQVEKTVVLTGYKDNPFPIISRSQIFAFPSRSEGFGLALVEAMALGVPVVVSNSAGGALEVIDYGRYGILLSSEDVEEWVKVFKRLLISSTERNHWARLAKERSKFFSIENFRERLYTVFKEVDL